MKPLILLSVSLFLTFFFAHIMPAPVQAAKPLSNAEFLRLSQAEQAVWTRGAFDALGHMAYQSNKDRAACIWRWLEDQRDVRAGFLLEHFRANPAQNPTTTILILLKHDCALGGVS